MKNINKLIALILALLLVLGAPVAFAGTYVSDPVSPGISGPSSGDEQPEGEATTEPEATPAPEETPAPEASAEPAPEAGETEAVVKTEDENGSVNIRAAASIDSEIIGRLTNDMHVAVLDVEGDWTKIRADAIVGYVASQFIQASEPEAPPTPEPVEVNREVRITTTLGDVVNVGDTIKMTAELIGFDGLTVWIQWQQNTGFGWRDVSGANNTSFSYVASEETVNSRWRAVVGIAE